MSFLLIEYNFAADQYIQNTGVRIVDEEYGFCYIPADDTIYIPFEADLQPVEGLTVTQYFYLNEFTCLGFWANAHNDWKFKHPDIARFVCKLFAFQKCYEFGIVANRYGLTPQSVRIEKYLNSFQPKNI